MKATIENVLKGCLIVFGLISVGAKANVIANGSFEQGLSSWKVTSNARIVNNSSVGGQSALRILGGNGRIDQLIKNFSGSGEYLFSFQGKLGNGGDRGYIGVEFKNRSGAILSSFTIGLDSTSYKSYTKNFTLPAATTVIKLYARKNGGNGRVILDNFRLVTAQDQGSTDPTPTPEPEPETDPETGPETDPDPELVTKELECASHQHRYKACSAGMGIASASLIQRYSSSKCTKDVSWGFNDSTLWVDKGCRAKFLVSSLGETTPTPNPDPDPDPDPETNPNPDPETDPEPEVVTKELECASHQHQYNACSAGVEIASASLVQRYSSSECVKGVSWGFGGTTLWVNQGCRARFLISSSGDAPSTPTPDPDPDPETEPETDPEPPAPAPVCDKNGPKVSEYGFDYAMNNSLSYLPIVPGNAGFGMNTTAGSGRGKGSTRIFKVTNLNTSGSGSLQACVEASGPRTCIFEISGVIDYRAADAPIVNITNDFITIAGQTAPSPGITVIGARFRIEANDVLIQHIRIRVGDDLRGEKGEDRDAIAIIGKSSDPNRQPHHVVIDHVSASWGLDEVVTVKDTGSYITLSNNIISEGLHAAGKTTRQDRQPHSKGLMMSARYATINANLIAHNVDRGLHETSPDSVVVNNLIYNLVEHGMRLRSLDNNELYSGLRRNNTYLGNVRRAGPDSENEQLLETEVTRSGSKVYAEDSLCDGYQSSWNCVRKNAYLDFSAFRVSQPPIWNQGLSAMPATQVLSALTQNAGARPKDRDMYDLRVIQDVKARTGNIKDCVSGCTYNAGGWPVLAVNKRTLNLPSEPNKVMPSGYTRLEEFLHSFYKDVQYGICD